MDYLWRNLQKFPMVGIKDLWTQLCWPPCKTFPPSRHMALSYILWPSSHVQHLNNMHTKVPTQGRVLVLPTLECFKTLCISACHICEPHFVMLSTVQLTMHYRMHLQIHQMYFSVRPMLMLLSPVLHVQVTDMNHSSSNMVIFTNPQFWAHQKKYLLPPQTSD